MRGLAAKNLIILVAVPFHYLALGLLLLSVGPFYLAASMLRRGTVGLDKINPSYPPAPIG